MHAVETHQWHDAMLWWMVWQCRGGCEATQWWMSSSATMERAVIVVV